MVPEKRLNKFERVKLLEQWGLNVPMSYLYRKGSSMDFSAPVFERWGNRLSLRTFPNEGLEFESPYYFDISVEEAKQSVPSLLAEYNVVINEPINPKDAKLAGCIMLQEGQPTTVEIARGPGVIVRDVTSGQRVDEMYTAQTMQDISDPDIRQALSEAFKVPLSNIVLEFSVYTKRIGILKQPLIFWDFVVIETGESR